MTKLRALVTGGAGLIGSHIVDLLIAQGWRVRILDNLERQTHRNGAPTWLPSSAEFMRGDVRSRRDWERALQGIDIVFHQAAYGGYMPRIAKFVQVNSYGTALMLETIRDRNLPVRKIVLASSQAVYDEGSYRCPVHGQFYGSPRATDRLAMGDYEVHCPICDAAGEPIPTDENAPIGGRNVYAISKFDQERLSMTWWESTGIPVTALRYSCTYGPRQSVFNPYTGVIAIFCTRLMNNLPPVVYEDGKQSRDLVYAADVARANLLAATDDRCDGQVMNVGTGQAAEIGHLARLLAGKLGVALDPELPGTFRPGEMRALISDIGKIQTIGFTPQIDLERGLGKYLDWIASQGSIRDYFTAAERALKKKADHPPINRRQPPIMSGHQASLSVPRIAIIVPCLNEGEVIGEHVREVLSTLPSLDIAAAGSEVIVVDNGSTDNTAAEAATAGARIVSEPRRGYGRACLSGARAAMDADVLVFMDGDRSDNPQELSIVLRPVLRGEADLVVGSRILSCHEPGSMTGPQRFGNWLGCRALSMFYNVHLTDFGPFRVIRRANLLALDMQEMTYGWPLEMLARAGKSNLRVVNVPVTWRKRAGGESKVSGNFRASVTTGYRYFRTLYRCR